MTRWREYLTPDEAAKLARLETQEQAAKDAARALRATLRWQQWR